MCCACGVTLLMLPWLKVVSFASARVRASGAQPEMARIGAPEQEVQDDDADYYDYEWWFNDIQMIHWGGFWMKVMMHDAGQVRPPPAFPDPVDEGLWKEYKMHILNTSPWVIPRRSRFGSCPDLPRFSEFELCGGHLRRSASDGCLEVRRSAKSWHLVDVDSPMVVPTDY